MTIAPVMSAATPNDSAAPWPMRLAPGVGDGATAFAAFAQAILDAGIAVIARDNESVGFGGVSLRLRHRDRFSACRENKRAQNRRPTTQWDA